jgi:hypothetical protein
MKLVGRFSFGSKQKRRSVGCVPLLNYQALAVAAISASTTSGAAIAATSATRTTSTAAGTASTMPSATSAASTISAAGRPIASWTIRTVRSACRYRFPISIFAIKVRLAAFFFGKVTAAFKGNGFFAFAAWLSWRTHTLPTAFSAGTLTRRPAAFAA